MEETPRDTASGRVARSAKPTRQHGPAIAALREKDGLSQTKFAKLLGISQPTLSGIESEQSNASMPMVNLIARRLVVPVAAIVRYREAENAGEDAPAEAEAAEPEVVAA
jgi:transcriptional regulator with XRE-family HTH domain